MESSPPYPIEPGDRVLAAILFTDVVNFSARMQAQEVSTLGLLEQDFAVMTNYCEKYSGWVLKSTGDGLLLYFSSAVHAVNCALQIQHFFSKRAKNTPADHTLTHRIGLHLGDVFVKDHDVMGDGVNLASRLQSVADPGGICISQTVYDVVKNKLDLSVERLSPRDLKNIADAGAIYRVLLEPRKALPAPMAFQPVEPRIRPAFSATEKWFGLVLLAAALAVLARLVMQSHSSQQAALEDSQATQLAIDALLARKNAAGPAALVAGTLPGPAAAPSRENEINFAELALNPGVRNNAARPPPESIRLRALEAERAAVAWVKSTMERYTKDAPLLVPRLTPSMPPELRVFTDASHRFVFATGGAARARAWEELKLADQEGLIVGTLLDSTSPPPDEVVRGAEAFAYLHGLPEMAAALRARKK
ncbi:MAG: repeat-containing protein [Verrucomicrobia bacterium]|nr:repeat-containing protein [Verrucomicrobiota bacterium]